MKIGTVPKITVGVVAYRGLAQLLLWRSSVHANCCRQRRIHHHPLRLHRQNPSKPSNRRP